MVGKVMLESVITAHTDALDAYFAPTRHIPLTSSVDIRHAGYKIASVDCNLFPAGLHLLHNPDPKILARALQPFTPSRVLIIPEAHTKNLNPLESSLTLAHMLKQCGIQTGFGWIKPIGEPLIIKSLSKEDVLCEPIFLENNKLRTKSLLPDLIILTNDCTEGYPTSFDHAIQPIVPSYMLGWHKRLKSNHAAKYNERATKVAALLGIDPFQLTVDYEAAPSLSESLDALAEKAQTLLDRLTKRYKEQGIKTRPSLFMKNNAGTYGMGVMHIASIDELFELNRRDKNKMQIGKHRQVVRSLLLQEALVTIDRVHGAAAEPVITSIQDTVLGGFYRYHKERSALDNLNATNMAFAPLEPSLTHKLVARIAAHAAADELQESMS